MTDLSFDDLADQAGEAAEEASSGGSQGTGEWVKETVELLDKRGLLEPMLFGPEQAEQVKEQADPKAGDDGDAGDDAGEGTPEISAETIAEAGEGIMEQLGDDVTVKEVVQICEDNPAVVNQQIEDNL